MALLTELFFLTPNVHMKSQKIPNDQDNPKLRVMLKDLQYLVLNYTV